MQRTKPWGPRGSCPGRLSAWPGAPEAGLGALPQRDTTDGMALLLTGRPRPGHHRPQPHTQVRAETEHVALRSEESRGLATEPTHPVPEEGAQPQAQSRPASTPAPPGATPGPMRNEGGRGRQEGQAAWPHGPGAPSGCQTPGRRPASAQLALVPLPQPLGGCGRLLGAGHTGYWVLTCNREGPKPRLEWGLRTGGPVPLRGEACAAGGLAVGAGFLWARG